MIRRPPRSTRTDTLFPTRRSSDLPWGRFAGVDPVLSPEMKSTGEVMGIDLDFTAAFGKSQLGAGVVLPEKGTLFVSVKDSDKPQIVPAVKMLADHGFKIVADRKSTRLNSSH